MPDEKAPEQQPETEETQSFADLLSQYEKPKRKSDDGSRQLEGTVVSLTEDSALLDIGYKTEGILPLSAFGNEPPKVGDKFNVSVKGRDPEGYYELSRFKERRPTDWDSLEKAFNDKAVIGGRVTGVVKGGLTVDIGVRAFMPASRTGARDAAEMEKLVDQEIRCRITKLEIADENVVVDRRGVLEEEERVVKDRRYTELKEGDIVRGEVRSLAGYGAFVDIGGVDGLLHVGEISWTRIKSPSDVLTVGQPIEARILKIEPDKRRISLSLKQLQAHPWEGVADKYKVNERVRGVVTRIADFGAFVELEPGIEGLIHISEMSWGKKIKTPAAVVKPGETVEAVILGVNLDERRISLGLKQALGDPWADAAKRFSPGTVIQGPVTKLMNFGAFVQLAEGIEGLVHISEITTEKRLNHPNEMLKAGQIVQAQVLAIDSEKRQVKLSMKQLVPTGIDEYIAEHKVGDTVSGRIIEVEGAHARVELGEGIKANCRITTAAAPKEQASAAKADLSSLTSMLQARWKSGAPSGTPESDAVRAGQVRSFRISHLNADAKSIEVELA